jgi:hypothetical protein
LAGAGEFLRVKEGHLICEKILHGFCTLVADALFFLG